MYFTFCFEIYPRDARSCWSASYQSALSAVCDFRFLSIDFFFWKWKTIIDGKSINVDIDQVDGISSSHSSVTNV